ncbi:MAG: lipocalin family protein [Thiolinea sp.]
MGLVSLQLKDGRELMYYQLRQQSGAVDQHSAGKWVDQAGGTQTVKADDVELKPLRYWSAADGRRYPVKWSLRLPAEGVDWVVEALLDDQLMQASVTYWEGRCASVKQVVVWSWALGIWRCRGIEKRGASVSATGLLCGCSRQGRLIRRPVWP